MTFKYDEFPGGRVLVDRAIAAHDRRRAARGGPAAVPVWSQCFCYPDGPLIELRGPGAVPIAVYRWDGRAVRYVADGGVSLDAGRTGEPVVREAGRLLDLERRWLALDEWTDPASYEAAGDAISEAERRMIETPATSIDGIIAKLVTVFDTDLDHPEQSDGRAPDVWMILQDLQRLKEREQRQAQGMSLAA